MSRQGGLSTNDVAGRVLEKEPEKLKEELKAKQKALGLDNMIPKKDQDLLKQLEDIGAEANHIKEQMSEAREKRIKRNAEERKAKAKSPSEKLKMIFMQQERKARQAYDDRRIVFIDGGFEDYEDTIRMMPYRVLLKEQPHEYVSDGIAIPDTHTERYPHYDVIAVGDGCDGIEEGMVVITEAYAGTEVVSKKNIYRIVTCDDIMGEVQ